MKKILIPLSIVGILFVGCNSVSEPNTPVKLYTPSKVSAIKAGSKIYIRGLHSYNYKSNPLIVRMENSFKKDGVFKIVDNEKDADVVININTFYSYRGDSAKDIKYNKEYFVKREVYTDSNGQETGGKDKLLMRNYKSSTGTIVAAVSIYDKRHLEPLSYFNIDVSDTSKVYLEKGGDYSSSREFVTKFSKSVVEKLNDLVSTKYKDVNVFLPKKASPKLTSLLLKSKYNDLFKESKSILPSFPLSEVTIKKYDEIKKESSKKGSKIKPRDIEVDLANFYVYYMAKEGVDLSKDNVKKVYNAYMYILSLTKDQDLILACSNSLGRIEFKADRLKINLGGDE